MTYRATITYMSGKVEVLGGLTRAEAQFAADYRIGQFYGATAVVEQEA